MLQSDRPNIIIVLVDHCVPSSPTEYSPFSGGAHTGALSSTSSTNMETSTRVERRGSPLSWTRTDTRHVGDSLSTSIALSSTRFEPCRRNFVKSPEVVAKR
ncbi:hypothetical protein DPMN_121337 [Dreissena polymorpha]|uniref:Uncharacterized protein n=1 Tax=Dreissena polymorpha TaxID=45954 RepID=A0A9D4GPW9_DREPO|nr:hypothetical protein DPMN_121337 [Dreissena polymorpha]